MSDTMNETRAISDMMHPRHAAAPQPCDEHGLDPAAAVQPLMEKK